MRLGGSGSSDRHRPSGLNDRNDLLAVLEAGVSVPAQSGPGEASPLTFRLASVHVYACVCEYVSICVCERERECSPPKRAPVLWDQGPVFMCEEPLTSPVPSSITATQVGGLTLSLPLWFALPETRSQPGRINRPKHQAGASSEK